MKLSFLIPFLFLVSSVFSQNSFKEEKKEFSRTLTNTNDGSIIKGTVIEEATGKPLPGVQVIVVGTKLFTVTDSDGSFNLRKMEAGKYNLQFSLFSFSTKIISDVEVINNEATVLTVSLSEMNGVLDEVVIKTVKAKAESINSLLTMQKNSIRVSDGISAESIKRTPDKTTSDVLKRISGASVQDNKFVIVRGLNERYNTSYLNGAPLPSSEPDRKAFAFDIFPANMIDNLVIYKTASPDLPGEFAGGVIEINTKATPDKNFQTVSIGGSYNTITTGKNRLYSQDTKTRLPSDFPSTEAFQSIQKNRTESNLLNIADLSKTYQTDWSLKYKTFSPNTSFQYTLGRYFKLKGDERVGMLLSVTNNVSNDYNVIIKRTYETPGALNKDLVLNKYNTQKLFAAIANVSLKLNTRNSFSFKNLYSVNSLNKVIDEDGRLSQNDPIYASTTTRFYSINKIYSGQLIGEHFLPVSKIKINWVGSYNAVNREVPNERRNSYIYVKNDDGTFTTPSASFSLNAIGSEYPGSIFSSKNVESIFSTKVDVSKKINFSDSFSADIKIGGLTQARNRDFQARQLGYVKFNGRIGNVNYGNSTFLSPISTQGNETIFNASNMGILGPKSSGLVLYDGTKGTDAYTAESKLDAAYVMVDNAFNKFRVIWGARLENYSQKLNSKEDSGKPILVDKSKLDILPSINIIYSLNKKQNIRLSGSKTLNRPEFRELAPFVFYNPETAHNTEGNPNLKIATIENADLRYELFPGKGQVFSVSTFYKRFTNPIEIQAKANNTDKYENAKSGRNFGVELEYRTLFSSIFGSKETKILDDLTFFTNLAVIRSKVDISNLVNSPTLVDIPMQGQSPYVFNAGLQYMNKEKGWSSALNLNKIGNRINIHGNQTTGSSTPAYWEKSRAFLDFQLAKSFLKNKLELKLNIQNILAQDLIIYQNNDLESTPKIKGFKSVMNSVFTGDSQNKNGYNSKEDDLNFSTKFGQSFSLTLNYSF
ncbi:MAG: outer membrane beta-barrel protein [Flavobacterium sp.]|uniref:TonB-dependent receptor n=1 Tax=Flavobacterium sp. TaxID=239 RepID=UPI0026105104|nr:TonB-dependent receptor [Flavobacterium sp.]MDD5148964.1 outer membrane beta-barrel protein [Flavobacterium sp.]